jgi:DNA-binding CsgD family transcriptional regulator
MQSSARSRCARISRAIQRAWQLTPAEARSASALALDCTPREIASAHDVSIHTVRTQLKRAMAKAGVHSQTALVVSVYSIVG